MHKMTDADIYEATAELAHVLHGQPRLLGICASLNFVHYLTRDLPEEERERVRMLLNVLEQQLDQRKVN